MSKTKCPKCGAISIRPGASKCPSCRAWVTRPALAKSRLRIGPIGLALLAAGLSGLGMLAGGAAVLASQGRLRGAQGTVGAPTVGAQTSLPSSSAPPGLSASAPSASASSASSAAAPLPAASASAADPGSSPVSSSGGAASADELATFAEGSKLALDSPPVDIRFSEDEALLFVLCEDGSLRAIAADSGAEKKRARLPGKGTALRRLPSGRLAVLGVASTMPLVDTKSWLSGAAEAVFLRKADVKGAVDIVAVGEPPVLVAAAGQGGRVTRLSGPLDAPSGELVFPAPVRGLARLEVGNAARVVVLLDARVQGESGAVFVFDPALDPFGGTRGGWSSVTEPRVSLLPMSDVLFVFDRATAEVVSFSIDEPPRASPAGRLPIAAFPWSSGRAVVIGAAGEATLASLSSRSVEATVALSGLPSSAVMTQDGKGILVALGGGPKGRGDSTVIVGGEPLRVILTLKSGEGSSALALGSSGKVFAVAATWAKQVTVFRRP